jgi:biopolymer transport protein ExbD
MKLPRARPIPVSIPAVTLADLTLLVVLCLVVTTTYDADRIQMQLPVSASPAVAEIGSPCVVLAHAERRGAAGSDLRVRWYDGRSPTRDLGGKEEIWLEASRVADRDPEATFVLKAEATVRWSDVDEVLESLRDAGARHVLLWTRPEVDGPGGSFR